MKKEKTYILILPLLLTLNSCQQHEAVYLLEGAWTLRHSEHPIGTERDFNMEAGGTFCRIYRGDSMFYECRITATPTGLVIVLTEKSAVTHEYGTYKYRRRKMGEKVKSCKPFKEKVCFLYENFYLCTQMKRLTPYQELIKWTHLVEHYET